MGTVGTFDAIIDVVLNIRVWTSMDLSLFNKGGWIRLMKNVDTVVPSILGDCMLIYRCWIVYDRRWKVIAPSFILSVAGIVLGITFVVLSGVLQSPLGVNNPALVPFVGAALALTVTVNLITTCSSSNSLCALPELTTESGTTALIVFRILQVDRGVRIFVTRNDKLVHFARIIIESGLLYTLSAVITLCTGATTSNADYITSDAMVQIAGIAFNLIIIRFEKNLADQAAVELQFLASSRAAHTIPPLAGGDRVIDITHTPKNNGLFDDNFGEEGNTRVCTL
ncbi:hypothetical protein CERSUDRAFT_96783 [Gelatoporia subvermispora B]|uniref:Transmembrane protein n=1 Tax=Ceriporiopsis subvermispora (strain B) TaxID=914234 RepID=M2RB77_CERS8|nr:hypothetical protein CERSUDRAFT_96783 [Gelatoporia subvermispora B]